MSRLPTLPGLIVLFLLTAGAPPKAVAGPRILLFAGKVKEVDKPGHHDYLGGCRLLEHLLAQNPGVEAVLIPRDWPEDESWLERADVLVFYTDGAGKQACLQDPGRVAKVQAMVDAGVGIVCLHQAVEFPPSHARESAEWTGATYTPLSGRGHWESEHREFPDHPVTRGVVPWRINDGWLNRLRFVGDGVGITPLVWSGKAQAGSPEGGVADVVAWTFERPGGGRSFSFSGLDAHSAWGREGLRKLVVNGILWSAGAEIPAGGATCEADGARIDSFLTPRVSPPPKKPASAAAAKAP